MLDGPRALTCDEVLKGFVARAQKTEIEARATAANAKNRKGGAWAKVEKILNMKLDDSDLSAPQLKVLLRAKLGPRGGLSAFKSKADRLEKWKEVKNDPWHETALPSSARAHVPALPFAAELADLGISPLPITALSPQAAPRPASLAQQSSLGAAVDSMSSVEELDRIIALAANRKRALEAGILE